MSFSLLRRMESCPRQWALLHAEYPGLKAEKGYPEASSFGALRGRVVHRALSQICKELVAAGCAGVLDGRAVAVLKAMGGYTAVIERAIEAVLSETASNFRMSAHATSLQLQFIRELPALRERLQLLLSRLRVTPRTQRAGSAGRQIPSGPVASGLGEGVYSELFLRSTELAWSGIADLVEVGQEHIQITEFKTSEYSDEHRAQLCAYAVIWWRDERLNPSHRVANRLVLSYPQKMISVAPFTSAELSQYECELVERTRTARLECAQTSPPAKPNGSVCPDCQVRHLCPEYWSTPGLGMDQQPSHAQSEDCEIVTAGASGQWSWAATILRAPRSNLPLPQRCTLYVRGYDQPAGARLTERARYRVLNCRLSASEDSEATTAFLLELTPYSEVFKIETEGGGPVRSGPRNTLDLM
jgi:hypothetical protein